MRKKLYCYCINVRLDRIKESVWNGMGDKLLKYVFTLKLVLPTLTILHCLGIYLVRTLNNFDLTPF